MRRTTFDAIDNQALTLEQIANEFARHEIAPDEETRHSQGADWGLVEIWVVGLADDLRLCRYSDSGSDEVWLEDADATPEDIAREHVSNAELDSHDDLIARISWGLISVDDTTVGGDDDGSDDDPDQVYALLCVSEHYGPVDHVRPAHRRPLRRRRVCHGARGARGARRDRGRRPHRVGPQRVVAVDGHHPFAVTRRRQRSPIPDERRTRP